MEILVRDMIDSFPCVLVKSESGEEYWIKVIDVKYDFPFQVAIHIAKHFNFPLLTQV